MGIMFNQELKKHAVLSVYMTRDNFEQQRAAKGDHDAVVTRRLTPSLPDPYTDYCITCIMSLQNTNSKTVFSCAQIAINYSLQLLEILQNLPQKCKAMARKVQKTQSHRQSVAKGYQDVTGRQAGNGRLRPLQDLHQPSERQLDEREGQCWEVKDDSHNPKTGIVCFHKSNDTRKHHGRLESDWNILIRQKSIS